MKPHLTLFLSLFAALHMQAQNIEVYFAKGEVVITQKGAKHKATQGLVLQSDVQVEIPKGAMLVLYQGEKAVVLKEAKTYSYSDLQAEFSAAKRSISDRYIAYIWKQAHEKDDGDDDEGEGNMGVTGMVSRGEGGILAPADSVICLSEKMKIELDEDIAPGYVFVYDRKKPLFNLEAEKSVFILEIGGELQKGKWYGVAASATQQAPYSGIRYFRWATEEEVLTYQTDFSQLLAEIEDFPEEQKTAFIQAYFAVNRYVQFIE